MNRYCLSCASDQGYLNPNIPENLFGTDYQLGKFIKQTTPSSYSGLNSIFTDQSTMAYQDYMISAVSSGYTEIDNLGRTNICWVGSSQLGSTYKDGLFYLPTNSIKVVLHHNEYKIHAFPFLPTGISANYCDRCGTPIL
jgi:hypothetical protein